jgi:hypothetical protein
MCQNADGLVGDFNGAWQIAGFDSDADWRIAVKQKVVALRDERSQPSGGRCGIAAVDKQVGRFAIGCLSVPAAGLVAAEASTNVGDPALLVWAQ